MSLFRCKMCGGNLEVEPGMTVGTCDSCGTKQTLPRLDDERRANLYDRANHFRRANEFDKAERIYEQILELDREDAEAYWSIVLCRYGIEYVEDPRTHRRVPTCNRTQFTSIFADEDYRCAVKYADAYQKAVYEQEAKAIDAIQKGILAISEKEAPFDVFICYKETDNAGRRTRDSVLAQELYFQLKQVGFNAFFSRISLEDKIGDAYEPYIFAALNSSRVMVVVGTSTENLNAVWVKNEWSRYLALMKAGARKTLIPAYKDMDPYDLPEEFSHLQAQDMGKLGFMQDLIRGIRKIAGAQEAAPASPTAPPAAPEASAAPGLQSLLKRANIFLEDGDFAHADEYFERVLDVDPGCAEAYFGQLKASLNIKDDEELIARYTGIYDKLQAEGNIQGTAQFSLSPEQEKSISELKADPMLIDSDFGFLQYHRAAYKSMEKEAMQAKAEYIANENITHNLNYQKALRFSDGRQRECFEAIEKRITEYIASAISKAKAEDEKAVEAICEDYSHMVNDSISTLKTRVVQRTEMAEAATKRKQRNKKVAAILIPAAAAIIAFVILLTAVIIPGGKYKEAVALMEAGDYDAAVAAFAELEEYRDARERILQTKYAQAETLLAAGDYDAAVAAFAELGEYEDAHERIPQTKYAQAEALLAVSDYGRAALIFDALGDYRDAKDRSHALWDGIANHETVSAGIVHTVGLKSGGTVVAVGSNNNGKCDVSGWADIVAVSAGYSHTVGLKSDGTVVAVGNNKYGQCYIPGWTDIVAVSAGGAHTVGLKSDGTVVAVGGNTFGQRNVSGWADIVAVSAGNSETVGLKSDGTVVAVGNNGDGQCNVSAWRDIVAVSSGGGHTVGLKADGTVVAVGYNGDGECNVSGWRDIVAVSSGEYHTVGLKADGTVLAVGNNEDGQCNVSGWSGIVAISAAGGRWNAAHTVGLKFDGTVVAVGYNDDGQCNVSGWRGIKVPEK